MYAPQCVSASASANQPQEPFPFDYTQAMTYSPSAQSLYSSSADSHLDSYAPSPYDEWSAMMPFGLQGCFPLQGHASQGVASSSSMGLGTRPIEIPRPHAHNGVDIAHLGFTPSYSSSSGISSSYLGSPVISQSSSMSMSLGDIRGPPNHVSGALHMHSAPVMSGYSMAHAASTPAPLLVDRPKRVPPRRHSERFFTRLADVKRHETSVHDPVPIDCPVEDCSRKGHIGFPRRDHLIEHLRTFHNKNIPKRAVTKKRKANVTANANAML
ncbi:hypothetical protein UA08_06478 [Talaromyces atroroseus]|uniref:C2H2-type domain-containing protein n=1 Tax=Talaromyces atroroseus TaxID=1441469 RepID=A0A225ACM8_TALAT|nr:hypothetical protein UA08_06478 [Talaromyces atroroseus]OKL58140.1 hypothetical protein UA08_06478 [Talaromyces atroroseus]